MAFSISYTFKAIDSFSGVAKSIQKSVGNINKSAAKLHKTFDKVSRKLKKIGKGMREVGTQITTRVTLPIVAAGTASLIAGAKFEKAMNQVKALTGATGKEFNKLSMQAKKLGATTQFSASESADAMGFLAKAGFKADKILKALPSTLRLAAAANLDMASAANIVTNIMSGAQVPVKDLAKVTDILTKAFTSANTDLTQLGEAFKFAGPVASAMKIPISEVTAVLASMGNAGIQAGMAGTALRTGLIRLAKPANDAKKIFKKLGIPEKQILDSKGNVKSLTGVIKLLEKSGANAADMMTIFGLRAGPAFQALVGQGSKSIEELTKKLSKSGGIAKKIADVQMKGLSGAFKALTSSLEGLAIAVFESGLGEFFTKLITKTTALIRKLSALNPTMLKIISIVAGVTAVIGPLLIAIGSIVQIFGFFGVSIGVMLGPITLIIAGIAALSIAGVLLYKNWAKVVSIFETAWLWIKKIASVAGSGLGKLFDFVMPKAEIKQITEVVNGTKAIPGQLQSSATNAQQPVGPVNTKSVNEMKGSMDINIKDRGQNVENITAMTIGGLNLGINRAY